MRDVEILVRDGAACAIAEAALLAVGLQPEFSYAPGAGAPGGAGAVGTPRFVGLGIPRDRADQLAEVLEGTARGMGHASLAAAGIEVVLDRARGRAEPGGGFRAGGASKRGPCDVS